jgi:hypothetical protein
VLQSSDLIAVSLSPTDIARSEHFARNAELGGVSRVRSAEDRKASLVTDQSVGQLGEMALSKYLGGTPLFYELTRTIRDLDPTKGDEGGDLLATNLDVKCSLMRGSSDPLKYRLLVRPKERKANAVYVLALVGPYVWQSGEVTLVGWCRDRDLPDSCARDGPFAGAHVLLASQLYPLPPLEFHWLWNYNEVTCRPNG